MTHRYRVELIRAHPDAFRRNENGDRLEIAEAAKTFGDYQRALAYMSLLGAYMTSAKIRANRTEFKMRDKRFLRGQIVIERVKETDQPA